MDTLEFLLKNMGPEQLEGLIAITDELLNVNGLVKEQEMTNSFNHNPDATDGIRQPAKFPRYVTIISTPDGTNSIYEKFAHSERLRAGKIGEVGGFTITEIPRKHGKTFAQQMAQEMAKPRQRTPKEIAEERRRAVLGRKEGRW